MLRGNLFFHYVSFLACESVGLNSAVPSLFVGGRVVGGDRSHSVTNVGWRRCGGGALFDSTAAVSRGGHANNTLLASCPGRAGPLLPERGVVFLTVVCGTPCEPVSVTPLMWWTCRLFQPGALD